MKRSRVDSYGVHWTIVGSGPPDERQVDVGRERDPVARRHALVVQQADVARRQRAMRRCANGSGIGVPAKWQATRWPSPFGSSGGSTSAQIGCAIGQRVRKRQPLGGFIGLGTSPGQHDPPRLRPGRGVGIAESSATVYGCSGRANSSAAGRELDDLAEVHDRDPVGDVADDREVVGDEEIGEAERLLELDEQVQHLRLDRDVERRHRLVGDDELRLQDERARDPDPLALAAAELVRVAVERVGAEADALEHVDDAVGALAPRRAVDREALADERCGSACAGRASRPSPGR